MLKLLKLKSLENFKILCPYEKKEVKKGMDRDGIIIQ